MMNKLKLIVMILSIPCAVFAEGPKAGSKYKIIKPIHLRGEYIGKKEKVVNKKTAKVYLSSVQLAKRRFTVFQTEAPKGTVMTIIGEAPKPWYLYFQGDRYFVKFDPDLSRGLDVKISLGTGLEGGLDGLNPEFFERMN